MSQRTVSVRTLSFRSVLLLLVFSLSTAFATAQNLAFTPGIATAYAGDPTGQLPVSGSTYTGPASGLVLNNPGNVTIDKGGNLYIIERDSNIVRVVAGSNSPIPLLPGVSVQAGQVYTVAGGTNTASSIPCEEGVDVQGNGCPATQAAIVANHLLGLDGNGNLYISDSTYNQIRVVYSGTGTIAGLTNPKQGYIYAVTNVSNSSSVVVPSQGSPMSAASSVIQSVVSMAVDSNGNIYLFDQGDYSLYVIYEGGALPSNFFSGATSIAGNMYFVSALYQDCPAGSPSPICDGAPVGEADFNDLVPAMAVDASGNLYMADDAAEEIRAVYVAGSLPGVTAPVPGNIYAIAGNGVQGVAVNGPALSSPFVLSPQQMGMAADNVGNMYFTATTTQNGPSYIAKIDPSDNLTVVFGGNAPCVSSIDSFNDGCPATSISNAALGGVAVDATGNIYASNNTENPQASSQASLIFKSDVTQSALDYSAVVGSTSSSPISVTNMGSQPLQLSSLTFTGAFAEMSSGPKDCSSSTSLATNETCTVAIGLVATAPGPVTGTLTISSNTQNATGGINTVTLNGTATQASSVTSLVASPSSPARVNVGQTVTFTATVAPVGGNTLVPTGNVAFMSGATQLGTVPISSGVATYSSTSLPAGTDPVTAVYNGDTDFTASTSSSVNVSVSSTPVAVVTLATSSLSANSGQSVTLTANVAAFSGSGIPTGTVSFQAGDNLLPNGTVTLTGGTATYTTSTLPAGTNQLVAFYSGDSQFGANASSEIAVSVASAGQLQLTPGVISLLAGNYFTDGSGGNGVSATSLAIPTNGLAVDSFGNTYISLWSGGFPGSPNNFIFAIAAGNGAIPGVANPAKGNIYALGTGAACTGSSPCGDGGPVGQASFGGPGAIAIDAFNNIYVADNGTIRKISAATGVINTVAGTWGAFGYSGDGGPATSANIGINNLFVDQNGNIYFVDNTGFLIRRVDAQTGIITTIAGNTVGAWTEVGEGTNPNACKALPCGDGGPATSASLLGPTSVFVDAANDVYFTESGEVGNTSPGAVVRKIDRKTGVISLISGQYEQFCTVAPCGDGGPASGAVFASISDMAGDSAGNLYIADSTLAVVREISAQTGTINTVIGTHTGVGTLNSNTGNVCTTVPCGDGGPATSALLKSPHGIAFDAQGNMYVTDKGTNVVREVSIGTAMVSYGSQSLGTTAGQTVTIANTGLQPLTLSGITISDNYQQASSGGTDCTSSTVLASGSSCLLDIQFLPTVAQSLPGTVTIASNSTNAANGQNTITLSGTGVGFGGTTAQSITFGPLPAGLAYGSQPILLNASSSAPGLAITYVATGPAIVSGSTLTITGAGTVKVTAYQFGDESYAAATPVSQSIVVAPATLTVTGTAGVASIVADQPAPSLSYTVNGLVQGDTQASILTGQPVLALVDSQGNAYSAGTPLLSGTYTITIKPGTLALTGSATTNYQLLLTNGTLSVTGETAQTLNFPSISNVTYGASPIQLMASASSGLPITYTVQGPATVVGNLLTITGAGAVAVTANQAGDSQYNAATPSVQSFNVSKAALNVTADNTSVAQGAPIPTLTYTITGFVNGDTQAVVTGAPVLSAAANSSSPIASYPITVAPGTLAAANYTFTLVPGTLSIVTPIAQTINFPAVPAVTYGVSTPITLNAVSSSGLGVSYKAVGPGVLAGNMLTVTGAGMITVTATQAGNATYGPATPVTQSVTVVPAVLTVTANDATRTNGTQNPGFTYTITGFVNGESAGVAVSGTPSLTTTATAASPVGTYPITAAVGNLNATNYTFNFFAGTLTIMTGGPSPSFSLTLSPQSLMVEQGQIVQSVITLSPVNYYQGMVKFTCGSLPANVTCTFSPATLAPDGSNAPITTTLTINTNSAAPVVGMIQPIKPNQAMLATFPLLSAGLAGLLIAVRRKRFLKDGRMQQWLLLVFMFAGVAGLLACGSSSSGSQNTTLAAPGSSVFTVIATDSNGGPSSTISVGLKVR